MKRWIASLLLVLPMAAAAQAEELTVTPQFRTTALFEDDRTGGDERTAFTLSRSEFGAIFSDREWSLTTIGEYVRSAAPGSLLGVAGNSYILRPRQLELARTETFDEVWHLTLSGGVLVRSSTRIHSADPLSEMEANAVRRFMGDDVSDLGAEVRVGYDDLVEASVALHNGEGASDAERNEAKNLTASLVVTPGGREGFWGVVPRLEGYREQGTLGSGDEEVTRTEGLLSLTHAFGVLRVRYGVASGGALRPGKDASWLRTAVSTAPIYAGLSLVGLHEQFSPDSAVDGSITRLGGGLRWQGEPSLVNPTATLWWEQLSSDEAAASVPGASSATEGSRIRLALTLRDRGTSPRP